MTSNKEVKVIFAGLALVFSLFVVGYFVGKHLAKAENSAQSVIERG